MMKHRHTKLSIACLVVMLTGCAQMGVNPTVGSEQQPWLKPGQARPNGAAATLLLYYDYVRNLSAPEYAPELERARLAAESEKSPQRTLQYVLALSLPGGDLRKAQQQLDGMGKENIDVAPELLALSNLLIADLAERRRLEAESKKFESDARKGEGETKRADAEAKKAEAESKRADAEAKRADELQKKLEALKNIEKNLIQHKKLRGDK